MNWVSDCNVAIISALMSSSSIRKPNVFSIPAMTSTTARESSSGKLPKSGVSEVHDAVFPCSCRASSKTVLRRFSIDIFLYPFAGGVASPSFSRWNFGAGHDDRTDFNDGVVADFNVG